MRGRPPHPHVGATASPGTCVGKLDEQVVAGVQRHRLDARHLLAARRRAATGTASIKSTAPVFSAATRVEILRDDLDVQVLDRRPQRPCSSSPRTARSGCRSLTLRADEFPWTGSDRSWHEALFADLLEIFLRKRPEPQAVGVVGRVAFAEVQAEMMLGRRSRSVRPLACRWADAADLRVALAR